MMLYGIKNSNDYQYLHLTNKPRAAMEMEIEQLSK